MKILSFACAQCLWRLRWAGAIAVSLVVAVLLAWPVPPGMGLEADRTAALWLHAPAFLLTAAALATAVDVWPLFARGRSGAEVVDRIQPGIISGCGMASAGALAALALWLSAVGAVFAGLLMALSSPPDLKTHYRLVPDREFLCTTRHPRRVLVGCFVASLREHSTGHIHANHVAEVRAGFLNQRPRSAAHIQ